MGDGSDHSVRSVGSSWEMLVAIIAFAVFGSLNVLDTSVQDLYFV